MTKTFFVFYLPGLLSWRAPVSRADSSSSQGICVFDGVVDFAGTSDQVWPPGTPEPQKLISFGKFLSSNRYPK